MHFLLSESHNLTGETQKLQEWANQEEGIVRSVPPKGLKDHRRQLTCTMSDFQTTSQTQEHS